jgi:3-oxoacyl-[acyl-carrier-protein] synthase-1
MIPLAIKAAGMVTAVGFNAASSCAAMRAGISGVKQSGLWDHLSGKFISAAKVSLPHWWEGTGKLAELVAPAIHECLVAAEPVPASEIALLLGVAGQDRPHRLSGLDDRLFEEIEFRLGVRFHRESKIIPRGHVSVVVAMQEARRLAQEQKIQFFVIAGVDSYLQQEVVREYIDEQRILTPKNSNGFIPGEGGGAVLVGPAGEATPELRIQGIGLTWEEASITSGKPCRGDGLTEAMRNALSEADLALVDVDYLITDLNGEHYKFKEASVAKMRLLHTRRETTLELWHPIEYMGEVGAATAVCALGWALAASTKGYAPGKNVVCHLGADNGERGAAALEFEGRGASL